MLDLVDPFGSYNGLPFWSWDKIPNIILHDRLILFDHRILPFFPFFHFFIIGRLFIKRVRNHGGVRKMVVWILGSKDIS